MLTADKVCSGFTDLLKASNPIVAYHDGGRSVTMQPIAKKDFWRKTYYEPVLVKDDAAFLYCILASNDLHYTVETHFTLTAASQFDQAGLLIRLDTEHWIKAGIEVVDGIPRLSCVVTNGYSDWSTQPWTAGGSTATAATPATSTTHSDIIDVSECRIRIHCRGSSFVVEAWINEIWEFIRIAHLSVHANTRPDPLNSAIAPRQGPEPAAPTAYFTGIFAACPVDQKGCAAHFSHFEVSKGSHFDHTAD